MIEIINKLASSWAGFISLDLAQDTAFLAIIFLMLYIFKNVDAGARYIIASFGLFKLLLPPFIPAPFLSRTTLITDNSVRVTGGISVLPANGMVYSEPLSFVGLLFLIWLMTAAISLIFPLLSTLRLYFKLISAKRISPEMIKPNLNKFPYQILKTEKINMPLTLGIFSKRVYVPKQWDEWSDACRKMILDHELAHIKRKDNLVQILQIIAQALYFFHPLVWILNTRMNQYREMACDDASVSLKGSSQVEYSRYLVQIAEDITLSELGCSSVSALIRQKNELLNRVQYQIKESNKMKVTNKRKWLIVITLFLLIIPFSWTMSKEVAIFPSDNIASETKKDGKINGSVYDQKTGEALSNTNVFIKDSEIRVKTDARGNYSIVNIESSNYDIETKAEESMRLDFELESITSDSENEQIAIPPSAPPPPTNVQDDKIQFVAYDTPPEPIGGFAAIQKNLIYPEKARKAEIEGTVIIYVHISEEGIVDNTKIMKSLNEECDQAAIDAIKSVEWKPALQGEKKVSVWVNVPVKFKLAGAEQQADQSLTPSQNDENLKLEPPPIPPVPEEAKVFVPYDTPPKPEGGFARIQKNLIYPEEARKASVEGAVIVYIRVTINGEVAKTKIVKSLNPECDKAAIDALKSVKWEPAKQKDKPVSVWVSVPVKFKLAGEAKKMDSPVLPPPPKGEKMLKSDAPPPPPKIDGEKIQFVAYDTPPMPKGGFAAIQKNLVYPEEARKANIQGTVVVYAHINEEGKMTKAKIAQSLNEECDEAAVKALKATKWEPAQKDDKPVAAWVSVPVKFKLK